MRGDPNAECACFGTGARVQYAWCIFPQGENDCQGARQKFPRKRLSSVVPLDVVLCFINRREKCAHGLIKRTPFDRKEMSYRSGARKIARKSVAGLGCMHDAAAFSQYFKGLFQRRWIFCNDTHECRITQNRSVRQ